MESAMPAEGGGSPRPGRRDNENWPNPLGFRGSSFTTSSQPVRVRKAEAFFTGFLEIFSGEILACSLILEREIRFGMGQTTQNYGRVLPITQIVQWDFRRYAEKEKHSHSSHSLVQFHTFRDRRRLFSHYET